MVVVLAGPAATTVTARARLAVVTEAGCRASPAQEHGHSLGSVQRPHALTWANVRAKPGGTMHLPTTVSVAYSEPRVADGGLRPSRSCASPLCIGEVHRVKLHTSTKLNRQKTGEVCPHAGGGYTLPP